MEPLGRKTGYFAATVIVGFCAAASRLLGFLREVLIASVFGTGFVADALLVGLRLPNLLRRTLSEGGAQGALVPWLIREKTRFGAAEARRGSGGLLLALALAGLGSWLLVLAFNEALMRVLAPGFAPDQPVFSLAAACLGLAFPLVGAGLLTAFATAWLSLRGAYLLAGLSGLLVNGAMVLLLVWFWQAGWSDPAAARWLALAMGLAGLLQAALLVGVVMWQADGPRLSVPVWDRIAPAGQGLLPSLVFAAAPQLSFLLLLAAATRWSGWSAQLVYAERLVQFPFGFIAAGLALVALPALSRLHEAGKNAAFCAGVAQALLLGLAMAVPAMTGLVLLADPIVFVLFRHGAFSAEAAATTAYALQILAFSLPMLTVSRVCGQAFFAQHFFKAPLLASLFAALTVLLLSAWAQEGADLAGVFVLAMAVDCLVLVGLGVQKNLFSGLSAYGPAFLKLFLCNGLFAACLRGVAETLSLGGEGLGDRAGVFFLLALVILASLAFYGLALSFCRLWPLLLAKNPPTTLHDA